MKPPSISIVIPTLNEEDNIKACLESITSQDYPKSKIEIIIVDNQSIDKTVEIAQKYSVKIFQNTKIQDCQVSKRMGFEKGKSELFMYLDADMRMSTNKWLKQMVKPLVEDEEIVASLVNYVAKGDESPLTRFLILDPVARDPIYQFFSINIQDTVVEHESGYDVCIFKHGRIPSQGLGLFRREAIKKSIKFQGNKFMDLDNIVHLVNLGYSKFAWVEAGTHHYFMPNLIFLIKKRLRNIRKNYLGQDFERAFTWFDFSNPRDVVKILFWIVYVNLFIPELVRGVLKSIKHRTWVGLYQPVISLLETDAIILGFVYYVFKPTKRLKSGKY